MASLAHELRAVVVGRIAVDRVEVIDGAQRRVFDHQRRCSVPAAPGPRAGRCASADRASLAKLSSPWDGKAFRLCRFCCAAALTCTGGDLAAQRQRDGPSTGREHHECKRRRDRANLIGCVRRTWVSANRRTKRRPASPEPAHTRRQALTTYPTRRDSSMLISGD
jgi:hypothetical protein